MYHLANWGKSEYMSSQMVFRSFLSQQKIDLSPWKHLINTEGFYCGVVGRMKRPCPKWEAVIDLKFYSSYTDAEFAAQKKAKYSCETVTRQPGVSKRGAKRRFQKGAEWQVEQHASDGTSWSDLTTIAAPSWWPRRWNPIKADPMLDQAVATFVFLLFACGNELFCIFVSNFRPFCLWPLTLFE